MEQALGMLYGIALGDALGAPLEFWDLKGIRERYGPVGIQELPQPARFTDDTQMTLAVAEALVAAGHRDLGAIMAAVTREPIPGETPTPSRPSPAVSAELIWGSAPYRMAGWPASKDPAILRTWPAAWPHRNGARPEGRGRGVKVPLLTVNRNRYCARSCGAFS